MGVLGGWAFSYERGTPVFLGPRPESDIEKPLLTWRPEHNHTETLNAKTLNL